VEVDPPAQANPDTLVAEVPPNEAAPTADVPPRPARAGQLLRIAVIIMVAATTLSFVLLRDHLGQFAGLGYVGLFLVGAIGSATVILPMPGLALAFAAGHSLSPLLVGLAFGTGAALGELTGYLAGYGGSAILSDQFFTGRIVSLLHRWGAWMVFVFGMIPNPFFDVVGIAAGALRIPPWQFFVAAWAGNVVKATLVAFAGAGAIGALTPLIQHSLGR
jgi:membrane protein YqaA with SNARE-associated domain